MGKRLIVLLACIALAAAAGGCTVLGSTYERKVKEADDTLRELNALKQKHQALTAEHEALTAKAAQLSKDLAGRTAELAQTKEQRDGFETKAKELDEILKSKSDQLSQIITDLRKKVADLEAENAKLKANVASLQKAVDERNKRVADLEGENGRLKQDVASLQKAKEEVQQKSKTYADLVDKMKSEIAQGQVTISELKGKLTLNMVDAILFDSGKAEVKEEGQEILKKVVSIVKDVKDKSIRVEGHTDNVTIIGMLAKKYPTNWELSAARALNVTRYLQDQGIDPAILAAVAYGEYKPVAPNDTPEGKQKNRRIEIILVPKE